VLVGVIGKPNVGKSTFFAAATMKEVQIADYPFTTIEPNVGVGYLTTDCVCRELGLTDNPRNSICMDGVRMIPVKLVDVAGLVEGAASGRGRGNQFLDELRQADALIQVVDASGSTDSEGRRAPAGSNDPVADVVMVEREFDMWIFGLLKRDWEKNARLSEQAGGKTAESVASRLSGLSVSAVDVEESALKLGLKLDKPTSWTDEQILQFATHLRSSTKPSLIAANKSDLPTSAAGIERLKATGRRVIPCASEAELLLRRAAERGLVKYRPGDGEFKVVSEQSLSQAQASALRTVDERVMKPFGGTGVQRAINEAYFSLLNAVVVFPVEDENKMTDKNGNVLPDAFVMKGGSTALDLARTVHSQLAEGFLYAIDARTKKRVAADYVLRNRDVLKIVSTR